MTTYNLFPGTPTVTAYADPALNLGTNFYTTAPGWLTQIRYLSGNGAEYRIGTRRGVIWKVDWDGTNYTRTMVAGPFTLPSPTGTDQWVTFDLPTPFALTTGQMYMVAVLHPDGGYPATSHYFDGYTDFVYGIVTVPASGNVPNNMQGSFKYTPYPEDAPDSTFNSASYYADVTVSDIDPALHVGLKVQESGVWATYSAAPKVYMGGNWVVKAPKRWDGSGWVNL